MKSLVLAPVLVVALSTLSFAQTIPNAGFETWANGNPVGWFTSNIPSFYTPITQSTDAHGGSSAVNGVVVSALGTPYAPLLAAGESAEGFPVNTRPAALHGWYKFASDSGDVFSATLLLTKNGVGIGSGILFTPTNFSVYTEFVVNATYSSGEIPDTANIALLISSTQRDHIGSTFTVDDLAFGPSTDVKGTETGKPSTFVLNQNFPNPFNPTTMIQFEIPSSRFVTLKVYNLLGQEVATLVDEQLNQGRYRAEFDASGLPSGTYFYRLQAGDFTAVKKLTVLK